MKNNILIELVISNQCNKRCKYCDLDFSNNFQTKEQLDIFIYFIKNNYNKTNSLLINFFGWEAILKFEFIEYFLNELKDYTIKYSIWTNGILLNKDKFDILAKYDTEIYLSIDTETYRHIFTKPFLLSYKFLKINFILNPETLIHSFEIFEELVNYGFKKFNVIPVYLTINWEKKHLEQLQKFVAFVKKFHTIEIDFFSYYQKPTSDLQFILDTNGVFYKDIHTHLWFLKQFSNIPKNMKFFIEKYSHCWALSESLKLEQLLDNYNQSDIFRKSVIIPKQLWFEKILKNIDKIIKW